eukprot:COSAG04_NODE_12207_length_664_cov_21.961062_1_plen_69_part_10
MRFGLWMVIYGAGLVLLLPVAWRLRARTAAADALPAPIDELIGAAVLLNLLASAGAAVAAARLAARAAA